MGNQPQIWEEEAQEYHDNKKVLGKQRISKGNETLLNQQSSQGNEIKTTLIPNTSIPEVEENSGNKLWEAVQRTQGRNEGQNEKPPLEEIYFEQKTLEIKIRSEYGDVGLESSQSIKANTLKNLPS